jgi:hypothetical protein
VYVRRFPSLADRRQVSTGEGSNVVWARNGRELIYMRGTEFVSHAFGADGTIAPVGRPVFRLGQLDIGGAATPVAGFDVGSDGRLLLAQGNPLEGMLPPRQINIIQNWFEEVNAKVPKQ